MTTQQAGLSAGFSGVALADILANGVAIIVIMIVVSLMIHAEQEREKLEQTEDIAVLLSREIASSLVMNSLPTSPPAVLHNYTTSPLDRSPNHATMPIIELHDKFVRNYYTGAMYPRNELLKHDNALDKYITSLTPQQLVRLRIDIYSIAQFYIAMSILKHHNHKPRHWHFLGETAGGLASGGVPGNLFENNQRGDLKTEGLDDFYEKRLERPSGHGGSLPEDVSLAGMQQGGGAGFQGNQSGFSREPLALPSTSGDRYSSNSGNAQSLRDFLRSRLGKDTRVFRTASDRIGRISALPEQAQDIDMELLVRAYFAFMEAAQKEADEGFPAVLASFDFDRHILSRLASVAKHLAPELEQLFYDLAYWLNSPILHDDRSLQVEPKTGDNISGQLIVLPINTPLKTVQWLRAPDQPELHEDVPKFMTLGMELNVYPEIYQKIRVPMDQDSIIMMPPPQTVPDAVKRWRIVTVVSPEVNDFITGFVYAGIDEQGRLRLPVDDNAVDIRGVRITSHFEKAKFLGESWQVLFYSLLILLFILGAISRYRRAG